MTCENCKSDTELCKECIDIPKRNWEPKCRASQYEDRRTKRNRTRSDKNNNSIKDSKEN